MTLELAKKYLRVDTSDDDELISKMLESANRMCLDILRSSSEDELIESSYSEMGVLYSLAYMYEHREEADLSKLKLTLRDLLSSDRREVF